MAPRASRSVFVPLACGAVAVANGASTPEPPSSMPLRADDFSPYPGYAGTMRVSGTVMIGQENDGTQVMFYDLSGTDGTCTRDYDLSNSCGIHVHVGKTCAEAGGHHYNGSSVNDDPWATISYRTVGGAASAQNVRVATGLQLSGVVGRTMVVHDANGDRVACAVLRAEVAVPGVDLKTATFQTYPQYAGPLSGVKGMMTIRQAGAGVKTGQVVEFSLLGVDPLCGTKNITGIGNACGIHVHEGMSCKMASEVGPHYYDRSSGRSDPWKPIQYAVKPGETAAAGVTILVETGVTNKKVEGRAMVVHDSTGGRISCALVAEVSENDGHLTSGAIAAATVWPAMAAAAAAAFAASRR